jgi:hypothetical protein
MYCGSSTQPDYVWDHVKSEHLFLKSTYYELFLVVSLTGERVGMRPN